MVVGDDRILANEHKRIVHDIIVAIRASLHLACKGRKDSLISEDQ